MQRHSSRSSFDGYQKIAISLLHYYSFRLLLLGRTLLLRSLVKCLSSFTLKIIPLLSWLFLHYYYKPNAKMTPHIVRTYAIGTKQKIEVSLNVMKTLQFWSKRISRKTSFYLSRTFIYTRVLTALFDKEKIIRSTPPTQFSKEFIKMTTTKTTKEFFDPGGHCSIATISHHYTIIPDPRPTMTFILRTDPSFPPITNPLRLQLQLKIPTRRTDK